ncbi:MAG: HD domain-containing protein [Acidibacillus sp.]|nr:HD domain-containing protein [Acidibacillus sp.]
MSQSSTPSILSYQHQADIIQLVNVYRTDRAHGERVMQFAQVIFELTKDMIVDKRQPHKSQEELLMRLTIAALLHDIGHYVNDVAHHKHSRYLIETARQTAEWDELLRADVARLVFTHRKKAKRSWLISHFENRRELFQLSAILRVADGLDRQHANGVEIVQGSVQQENYTLELTGLKEIHARRIEEKKADAWKFAFGHSLALKTNRIP